MPKNQQPKTLSTQLRAVDFFCGAGGVSCGFRESGIKILGGIDKDSKVKKTYEENNLAELFKEDISDLAQTPEILQNLVPIFPNEDNLIFVGCSPCQYYSNLKSDKTKSEEGRLLLDDFKEFVIYYKPGFVFIENVPGLETKEGSPIHRFKKALQAEGYVFDQKVLNAKYFGVPQNRRRFVLVATRLLDKIELPQENKKNIVFVKDVIGDYKKFPKIKAGTIDNTDFIHSTAGLSALNLERVKNTPKNGGTRKAWEDNDKLQLDCYKTHKGHYDVYGRMYWRKPSPTITTRFIYTSTGRYSHPEQNRGISLREGATLQSFPLDYKFYSSNTGTIATMIGNAVPPKLAQAIGESIKNHYEQWLHSKQKHEQ